MKSYVWKDLDEAGRYEVWSLHMEFGGADLTYPAFCDLMDNVNG